MLNRITLMGRLTADPELKKTPSDISVVTFTLAVERNFSKEKQTDFIDIVCWRNTAEFVSKYFSKGQLIAVSGALQTRTWKDKEDKTRKAYEVVADEVYFAEGKRDGGGTPPKQSDDGFKPVGSSDFTVVEDDDDLPF